MKMKHVIGEVPFSGPKGSPKNNTWPIYTWCAQKKCSDSTSYLSLPKEDVISSEAPPKANGSPKREANKVGSIAPPARSPQPGSRSSHWTLTSQVGTGGKFQRHCPVGSLQTVTRKRKLLLLLFPQGLEAPSSKQPRNGRFQLPDASKYALLGS